MDHETERWRASASATRNILLSRLSSRVYRLDSSTAIGIQGRPILKCRHAAEFHLQYGMSHLPSDDSREVRSLLQQRLARRVTTATQLRKPGQVAKIDDRPVNVAHHEQSSPNVATASNGSNDKNGAVPLLKLCLPDESSSQNTSPIKKRAEPSYKRIARNLKVKMPDQVGKLVPSTALILGRLSAHSSPGSTLNNGPAPDRRANHEDELDDKDQMGPLTRESESSDIGMLLAGLPTPTMRLPDTPTTLSMMLSDGLSAEPTSASPRPL